MKLPAYAIVLLSFWALNFSNSILAQAKLRDIAGWEFHASVNHPLGGIRTFYGGGIGANILLKDTGLVSFKTGLEVNYFHTWDEYLNAGHFASQRNVHYQYAILSIPAVVRFNMGNEFKLFVELGGCLGIALGGEMKSDYTSFDPYTASSFKGIYREDYAPELSFTPTLGLGGRFHLTERVDLLLKPEFAFVMYSEPNNESFNRRYFYIRFCAGIHLKPQKK